MKAIRQQSGFTVVEGLLFLILFGIVGFVGWFVWQSKNNADTSYNNSDKVSSNLPKYTSIRSFEDCKKAGGKIQESYPEVCVLGSKSFTNPDQQILQNKTDFWKLFISGEKTYSIRIPDGWNLFHQTDGDLLYSGTIDNLTYKKGMPAKITKTQGGRDGLMGFFVAYDEVANRTFQSSTSEGTFIAGNIKGQVYSYKETEVSEAGKIYTYYFIKEKSAIYVSYSYEQEDKEQFELVKKVIRTVKFL